FLFYIPRAARLSVTELVVGPDRVVRERRPEDPFCDRMVIYDFEGELFFGASPELEDIFDSLRKRVDLGAHVLLLRFKRTRNPDMVCMELLQHFLEDMRA